MNKAVAGILFIVLFFGICFGAVAGIKHIVSPRSIVIGPNDLFYLLEDEKIISSEGNQPISFKSGCNFVLQNLETHDFVYTEVIPAEVGDSGPTYKISDFTLNGEYKVRLCPANVYARETTTISVENWLLNKVVFSFFVIVAWLTALVFIIELAIHVAS